MAIEYNIAEADFNSELAVQSINSKWAEREREREWAFFDKNKHIKNSLQLFNSDR